MKRITLQTVFLFLSLFSFGQSHKLAILDLCERNNEVNKENLASAIHMAEVAGMPYVITTNPTEANTYPFVLITSPLKDETLQLDEIEQLTNYVHDGGILVAPFISSENYFDLFGINSSSLETNRYWMRWDMSSNHPELKWVNEELEQELPLADSEYYRSISTRAYTVSQASALAFFEDNSIAITVNNLGEGKAYTLGFDLRDIILKNLMNKDYNAHRTYSNGFEPTTDMFLLFLRAVYTTNQEVAIYKHTSPGNSTSALLITHDVDSQTGVDSMFYFSEWEANNGIKAHYFVTTHYFRDARMSNYYEEKDLPKLRDLLADGHVIGSHSVGHFPDFADRTLFPIGETGNTKENYHPVYQDGSTTGGTVTGELEVSRDLLNTDIGANVRSFRAGHLAFNLRLINVMSDMGYAFNSTNSANDVLTNFPYRQRTNCAYSGEPTEVYEIPLTISDASKNHPLSEETFDDAVENWANVVIKNDDNNAPTILLIHPNRGWKLDALKGLVSKIPSTVIPFEFDAFGDYWLARRDLDFDYALAENKLQIQFVNDIAIDENQSLVISNGKNLESIVLLNLSGEALTFQSENWKDNDILITRIGNNSEPPVEVKTHRLAILDICDRNGETNKENLSSTLQMADVAGIPFSVTTSLTEACSMDFILITSALKEETLSSEEVNQLKTWVSEGGILIAPFIKSTDLFDLFGIQTTKLDRYRYTLNWTEDDTFDELKWIDDSLERTLPLADANYYKSIYTRGYTIANAQAMATFEDGKIAVCRNNYGDGKAYAFGVEWKDVILRNLLNKDYKAQRSYSNGFEPTTDVFMLMLRAIFTENQEVSVYKHTSPGESTSTLLVTHDVDSRKIIATMDVFSNWEFVQDISTHYFVATHYFKDSYMSAYYEASNFEIIQELPQRNHTIGSHSVGHFPDFAKTSVFPTGEPGNTQFSYQPFYNGSYTVGGTVYGELEVSRDLLNNDIGANVRSFRAGALAFNNHLANVMDNLGYAFSSSMSANNVLTNFPYFQRTNRAFSGNQTNVLEIPLTIKDASTRIKLEETNIDEVVDVWTDVIVRNDRNNASSTLLISPNRDWKLEALQNLLESIPSTVITYNFEDFGDYWLDRSALDFDYSINNGILTVEINSDELPAEDLSMVVENGSQLDQVMVNNNQGEPISFSLKDWNGNDMLITFGSQELRQQKMSKINIKDIVEESQFSLFPNPAKGFVNLLFNLEIEGDYTIRVMDINGRIMQQWSGFAEKGSSMQRIDLSVFSRGIYLIDFKSANIKETLKLSITH